MHSSFRILVVLLVMTLSGCLQDSSSKELSWGDVDILVGEIILCSGEEFGEVSFSLLCSFSVRDAFNLAVSLLHSFEYDEAEKAFVKVIDIDPQCAMAYWGVAMCSFHALWRPPTTDDLIKGSKAIELAKSIRGKSSRESNYIDAISVFYENWEQVGHQERKLKFEKANFNI